ncbi:MAG: LacI family DNA-binding transcriptional regulator [Fimbriimonas sp.]
MKPDRSSPAKPATIREVAERAGVATMTVSRVLNGSGYASETVRKRVLAAVDELGYMPNQLARSLRSQRTGTIALLLSDVTNPFFTTVARGVEDAASDAGSLVLLCNTDESEEEELRYMRMLVEKRVDGVLLVPARDGTESIALAKRHGVPVVAVDRRVADPSTDVVRCDSARGAAELGRLLRGLGHRRIAVLAGPQGVSTSDERVAAFVDSDEDVAVFYGQFTQASGRQMVREALTSNPTALFATNNFISIGAMQELHAQGRRVPEEIALVGFDDLPESLITFPFLTMVSQPAYEMGHRAVNRLHERLAAKTEPAPTEIVLPTHIVIRHSSGKKIS